MQPVRLLAVVVLLTVFIKVPSLSPQNRRSTFIAVSPPDKPPRKVINVRTVYELYEAVNNKENKGALILLAPGEYKLATLLMVHRKTYSPPNKGRIEFQTDMEIRGFIPKNYSELKIAPAPVSIIDGSGLPDESFTIDEELDAKRTGFIRMGKGTNALSWVTVKGNPFTNPMTGALSAIDTDLPDRLNVPAPGNVIVCSVSVHHTLIMNCQTGIDIRNGGARGWHRSLTVNISDNELRNNKVGGGQGITIQNSGNADVSIIDARLERNISHFNNTGIRVMNQSANSGKITIKSYNDHFEDNSGNGILIYGGMDRNDMTKLTTANGNSVSFEGHNTHFNNNNGTPDLGVGIDEGGMYVVGGFSVLQDRTNDNNVRVTLYNPVCSRNTINDVNAYGSRSVSKGHGGRFNSVNISITGASPNMKTKTLHSIPLSPFSETNTANLIKM